MSLKDLISSPLEAGTSILDAHHLPPHVTSALEYASKRLARKGQHVTLVVVRKEYQLPFQTPSGPSSPTTAAPMTSADAMAAYCQSSAAPLASATTTSARPGFGSAIRQLVRTGTHPVLPSLDRRNNHASSELKRSKSDATVDTTSTGGPRLWWPLSPSASNTTPATPLMPQTPMTPATPATTISSAATDASQQGANPFGLRLVHATTLGVKQERVLRQTIEKAERKFRIGTDWLSPAMNPSTYGLSTDIIRRSILQNEVLFGAEGLTLLALDHLYTFKSALAAYAASGDAFRLEDAVDELRRYVLKNNRGLLRADLLAAYPGLRFREAALADVRRMYRRAYGGLDGDCGVEYDAPTPVRRPRPRGMVRPIQTVEKPEEGTETDDAADIGLAISRDRTPVGPHTALSSSPPMLTLLPSPATIPTSSPPIPASSPPATSDTPTLATPRASPLPKLPTLKLQTTFARPVARRNPAPVSDDEKSALNMEIKIEIPVDGGDDEEEELTARPSGRAPFWSIPVNGASIDELLSPMSAVDRGPRSGPMTPNGYDDISPITRGEWGFLFPHGEQVGRQVGITTC